MEIKNNAKENSTLELGDILEVSNLGVSSYYMIIKLDQPDRPFGLVSLTKYNEVDAYEDLIDMALDYPLAKIHKSKNVELVIN